MYNKLLLLIPKDVWWFTFDKLDVKDKLSIRNTCKYFNKVIKEKFNRYWFRLYIRLIIETGNYAKKYGVVIPKKHEPLYIKKLDLVIPYRTCYKNIPKGYDIINTPHMAEFMDFVNEGNNIVKEKLINEEDTQGKFTVDQFSEVYAYTKILDKYYEIDCRNKNHYCYDLPKDEKNDKWFDTHDVIFNKERCYLSHYLIANYRIERDRLVSSKRGKKRKSDINYKTAPFFRRKLEHYRVT